MAKRGRPRKNPIVESESLESNSTEPVEVRGETWLNPPDPSSCTTCVPSVTYKLLGNTGYAEILAEKLLHHQ